MPVFSQAWFDSFSVDIDGSVMSWLPTNGTALEDSHSEDKHAAKIAQSEIPALDKHVQDIV